MAGKSDFTAEEWKLLLGAPTLAGMAVTLAEPSGIFGMLKEGMASAKALLEAKHTAGTSQLVQDIVADFETAEGRSAARDGLKAELSGKSPGELKAQVMTTLGQIGALLDAKAPADAAGIKAWLGGVAEKVAEASTEGGFLGFGGVKVSDAEKATLAELRQTLRIG